ncbi:GH39 family glycosyl hydrolase [Saccharothrix deserti]|uniref:GH39 family glycosyl hydrolase n=1 Tax=Saccharothrix deserti TaxID=2593674 RepID=UPI00131AB8C1|nr:hypothetical protein [Saccharothrix deserti]
MRSRRSRSRGFIGAAAAVALVPLLTTPAQAAVANVTVDFGAVVRPVPRDTFSADITGYGYDSYITNDPQHRAMLAGRYGSLRMQLVYATPGDPTSAIVAGGDGADRKVAGDAWVTAIKDLGAEPVLIVPENATDAANLVRHFNLGGNRVGRWIIGNEPNAKPDGSPAAYGARFNAVYDAMKAVDPAISVGGPAVGDPNMAWIRDFLAVSGSRTDFVDFHKYGAGEHAACDSTLLAETAQWSTDVAAVRDIIASVVPSRADRIGIQIGETNSDWGVHPNPAGCDNIGTEPVQYRNAAIWWSASVFGRLAEAGARGYVYGDKNGALGLLYDQPNTNGAGRNERMPVYQGVGFFTGQEGTALAHFGSSLVRSSTTLGNNVEVYASANPKVVVIVNKGTTPHNAVIGVGSGLTQAAVHQKDGNTVSYAKPTNLGTVAVSAGQVSVALPGPSVTQLVLS